MFANVLCSPLQLVIAHLLGSLLLGGITGRSIQSYILIARSVLEAVSVETSQVAHIQVDLAKEFDKVRRKVLFLALEHANIGDVFLKGIRPVL